MCKIETPQDQALIYSLDVNELSLPNAKRKTIKPYWKGAQISSSIKLATDPQNMLKGYY
jgi:hypothetical protein